MRRVFYVTSNGRIGCPAEADNVEAANVKALTF
jgi:hypothetical protein